MASLLSAASSYIHLSRSQLLASYTVHAGHGSPTLSSGGKAPGQAEGAACQIGLWHVQRASNTHGKQVSLWIFDRATGGGSAGASSSSKARQRLERAAEVAKREATSISMRVSENRVISTSSQASLLARLRHPCILEVVEPLEETRSSFIFATEPVTAPLRDAMTASGPSRPRRKLAKGLADGLELDEVEIQKGLLQVGQGLHFLHEQAKLVHLNLTDEAIVINAKGDWKLAGFGLSTYLAQPDGTPSRWTFPEQDHRLAPAAQLNFDYLAPEYAVDEQAPSPPNDMYSLGCLVYAIHTHAGPPFSNHGDLEQLRSNADSLGVLRAQWSRLPDEIQDVLAQLVTRYPSGRLDAASFQTSRYFNSVLVATLRFLDRDNFNGKSREEQSSFMKGLTAILPQFSDKVVKRKILPSLLEETRKHMLLPFLLPNIFLIANKMNADEFREDLLPQLKPLFAVREPPQSVLALLDNIQLFESKCTPEVFREEVMPLVYSALDSEVQVVLERALAVVPKLAATLDYTTVKNILFPSVAKVFSKTTFLSVKVNTLICFHAMIPTLDKYTLTEKLVPLLSRVKTKEPSVMVATLAVHEEMGKKCEVDAIATLILPQLWAMSMGPLLNSDQFARFMTVIRKLGARVEAEHGQHLAELKRLENTQGGVKRGINGTDGLSGLGANGEVDFETLVRGAQAVPEQKIAADPFGSMDDSPANLNSFFTPSIDAATRVPSPAPAVSSVVGGRVAPLNPSPLAPSIAPMVPPPPSGHSYAAQQPSSVAMATSLQAPLQARSATLSSPPLGPPPGASAFSQPLAPTQSSLASTYARPFAPTPPVQKSALGSRPVAPTADWNVVRPATYDSGILQPNKAPPPTVRNTSVSDLDPFG